jgi:hypothetical protein
MNRCFFRTSRVNSIEFEWFIRLDTIRFRVDRSIYRIYTRPRNGEDNSVRTILQIMSYIIDTSFFNNIKLFTSNVSGNYITTSSKFITMSISTLDFKVLLFSNNNINLQWSFLDNRLFRWAHSWRNVDWSWEVR